MFSGIFSKLKRWDAYPKPLEDFSIKTIEGATVTILSWIIILVLIGYEIADYLSPKINQELFVDTSRSPNLLINLDIVIPAISCDFLTLDAMDAAGEQHLHIEHNIYKRRLDLQGNPIEEPKKEDILKPSVNKNEVAVANSTEKPCGSCYGAERNSSQCCNTCEEVKEAYRSRSWELKIETVEQCKSEKYQEKLKSTFTEGCQIYGKLEVNRVEGSFHIAPGQSFPISEIHLHDVRPFLSTSFNTSHTIRHLSFGPHIENANTNLLNGHHVVAEEGATMFQYYLKIVPIAFAYQNHSIIYSNQYSVTTHKKTTMPGIFFSYDISSFMIKYTINARSLGHLLTTICAIVGGVYTVAAIIVSFIYSTRKALEKIELGKAS